MENSKICVVGFKPEKEPQAEEIPYLYYYHGQEMVDNYNWLRDKNWPKVSDPKILHYLDQEKHYYQNYTAKLKERENSLYQELVSRIPLEDSTVPIKKESYYYYSKVIAGSQHTILCRKKEYLLSPEEVLLDCNVIAKGSDFFKLGTYFVSPDHKKLFYSYDVTGEERYLGIIKDLETGENLCEPLNDIIGEIVWHENNQGLFYTKLNAYWRADSIFYHRIENNDGCDELIFKEEDPSFELSLKKSNSNRFVFIISERSDKNEIWAIDLSSAGCTPKILLSRKYNHLYYVDHQKENFYVLTNDAGKNFRLISINVENFSYPDCKELLPCSQAQYLNQIYLYEDCLVIQSKEAGLGKVKIYNYEGVELEEVKFPDSVYKAQVIYTSYEDKGVRILYSSPTTPDTVMEYLFNSKGNNILKTQLVPNYNRDLYHSEYIFVEAADGTRIPVSISYKRGLFYKDGTNPLYLYGYGAYGYGITCDFKPEVISLLDQGIVYAIAHVRGGDELGYNWYEDGKLLKKKNTFKDFITVAKYLLHEGYVARNKLVIAGKSAGGMLIGVCLNECPDLFAAAIMHVPFVDVLNTMFDEDLPLTPPEFEEWGNPKEKKYFDYIKSYSPYDNIKEQAYPAVYITASIKDPRVTYWEPAKWVAKLRKTRTNRNPILLNMAENAGHAGLSARFERMRDIAKEYSFIFGVLDK